MVKRKQRMNSNKTVYLTQVGGFIMGWFVHKVFWL